jgi:hypothetical protein
MPKLVASHATAKHIIRTIMLLSLSWTKARALCRCKGFGLLWLLRDGPHIEATDLRANPFFAQVSAPAYQLKFFGERLRTGRRRLSTIAPSTAAGIDRTKRNVLALGATHEWQ